MRLVPFSSRLQRSGEPFAASSLRSELDRVFRQMMQSPWPGEEATALDTWVPSVDIAERESEIILRAEVPGIKPDDIDVTVSGERLIISGEKTEQHEEKQEHYHHCERRFGMFERSIELPASADLDRVSAEHANGVLTIHVPKLETAKPKRVEIASSSDEKSQQKSVAVNEAGNPRRPKQSS